jgi:hypothetical protein
VPPESAERPAAKIGFGGLSHLVSEVDGIVADAAKRGTKAPASGRSRGDTPPQSQRRVLPQTNARRGVRRIQIYAGAGLALWAVATLVNSSGPSSGATESPSRAVSTTSNPSTASVVGPYVQQRPARKASAETPWTEQRPPAGQSTPFDAAQIRYCLAENVRLAAARGVVSSGPEIGRFNSMIDDYNARCSSYQYHAGQLESVQREVQARTSVLRAEGIARFR